MPGEYRTDDMALATLLRGRGFSYRLERTGFRRAVWVFTPKDEEALDDVLDEYEGHTAQVEPRSFTRDLADVRNELFRFLGEPERRRDSPHVPSPGTASA